MLCFLPRNRVLNCDTATHIVCCICTGTVVIFWKARPPASDEINNELEFESFNFSSCRCHDCCRRGFSFGTDSTSTSLAVGFSTRHCESPSLFPASSSLTTSSMSFWRSSICWICSSESPTFCAISSSDSSFSRFSSFGFGGSSSFTA